MTSQMYQGCQQQCKKICLKGFYEHILYNQWRSPITSHLFFFFFIDSTITTTLILIKLRGYRYTHVYVKSFRFTQHMLQGMWSWTRFILEGAQSHQPSMVIYQSPDNLSCIHTHLFNCAFRHSHVIMHRGGKSEDWYIWNDTYVYVATG